MGQFRLAAFIIAFAVTPGCALAYDHLVPEDSALALLVPNQYRFGNTFYLKSLAPAFDQFVRVFVVEEGSPFPESVIGLKKIDSHYYIFGAQPSGPTSYVHQPAPLLPPLKLLGTDGKLHLEPAAKPVIRKPPPYVLKTCKQDIGYEMAERIVKVWDSVLLQTRPEAGKPQFASDGANFHFGSNMAYTVVTGFALNVPHNSRPGWLGLIGYDLSAICWNWKVNGAEDPKHELEQAVGHLEAN
jgi:hypothetical protein